MWKEAVRATRTVSWKVECTQAQMQTEVRKGGRQGDGGGGEAGEEGGRRS